MNIFYVEASPRRAAQALCDKHVNKMTTETAQMLSTAVWRHLSLPNRTVLRHIWKPAYLKHPSTVWVGDRLSQYVWAYGLLQNLCKEFTFRGFKNGEPHAAEALLHSLGSFEVLAALPTEGEFEAPPQCMPEKYYHIDTMQAYRNYYLGEKMGFAVWERGRPAPDWVVDGALERINERGSDDWTPYTREDWREGWDQWVAHEYA